CRRACRNSARSTMMRFHRLAALTVLAASITMAQAQQQATGSLQGTVVRDPSGDPLSKASVELRGGQVQHTTNTRLDGRFYFHNLPPGAYEITVRRDGFAPTQHGQKWPGGPGL